MLEFMAIIGLAIMANITKMVKIAAIAWPHVFKNMAIFDVFLKNGRSVAKTELKNMLSTWSYGQKKIRFEIMAISFVF